MRAGLCFGKELPPVCFVKENVHHANCEEESAEEGGIWQRPERTEHEGHPACENGKHRNDPAHRSPPYLCSKSTGAVTSCTRKYLSAAGCFRATASRRLARHLVYFLVAIAFSSARRMKR